MAFKWRKKSLILLTLVFIWFVLLRNKTFHADVKSILKRTPELKMCAIGRTNFQDSGNMQDRLQRIQQQCRLPQVEERLNNILEMVSTFYNYKQIGICKCRVPKAASTSIGRLLLMLEYPNIAEYIKRIQWHKVHIQPQLALLKTNTCIGTSSKSIMVTRHPYSRIFSAYIDKIYLEKFGEFVVSIDLLHQNPQRLANIDAANKLKFFKSEMCKLANVSFEQFLTQVAYAHRLDIHYTPVAHLCNPCMEKFDMILKQEYLQEEIKNLFNIINTKQAVNNRINHVIDMDLEQYENEAGLKNLMWSYYIHLKNRFRKNNCTVNRTILYSVNERLWNAMKMLGYINEYSPFISEIFINPVYDSNWPIPEQVLSNFRKKGISFLNSTEKLMQRNKYLAMAYRRVNDVVTQRIRSLFYLDFVLFDYDASLPTFTVHG